MPSYVEGKHEAVRWVIDHFPKGSTCLDVGACDGKWSDLLGKWLKMDAVEIFPPYVSVYNLQNKYRNVYVQDISDLEYEWYDLILFGDVIEHMSVEKAQKVLAYAEKRCRNLLISVPFLYRQGAVNGNKYQAHIQDDLTPEIFDERYPGFKMICRPIPGYAYYVKQDAGQTQP